MNLLNATVIKVRGQPKFRNECSQQRNFPRRLEHTSKTNRADNNRQRFAMPMSHHHHHHQAQIKSQQSWSLRVGLRRGVSTLRYDMAEHFHDSIVCVEIILRFREVRGRRPANHGAIIRRSVRQVVCGDVGDTHSRTLASGERGAIGAGGGDESMGMSEENAQFAFTQLVCLTVVCSLSSSEVRPTVLSLPTGGAVRCRLLTKPGSERFGASVRLKWEVLRGSNETADQGN